MLCGFVYILYSSTIDRYYIGSSINPEKRLHQHNQGSTVSRRKKGPWKLVFMQKFNSLLEAKHIETRLKHLKRRDYIEQIIRDGNIKISGTSAIG